MRKLWDPPDTHFSSGRVFSAHRLITVLSISVFLHASCTRMDLVSSLSSLLSSLSSVCFCSRHWLDSSCFQNVSSDFLSSHLNPSSVLYPLYPPTGAPSASTVFDRFSLYLSILPQLLPILRILLPILDVQFSFRR